MPPKKPTTKKTKTEKPKTITKRNAKGQIVATKRPKGSGRKYKLDNPETQQLFLAAASFDARIKACCAYADISIQSYERYIKANPSFVEKIEKAREIPYLKAVEKVMAGIERSPSFALKYLERRAKDEFATRNELTGANGSKLFEGMSDDELRDFIQRQTG
jgi:ribosome-binding protein aMBF1 (putative translation factor)